ncbi:MAG: SIS domain-containing protein [Oligoflexia bacterium]|nr:SIS domain-containing protein [Oligoflexia bacterium]
MSEMPSDFTPTNFASNYLKEAHSIFDVYLGKAFTQAMEVMWAAYEKDKQVFIFGNGGSAGTSSHMVNDLSKGTSVENKKRLRVMGLADNMSLLTAYANDCGYESIFAEQLKNLLNPGDVCIAISASGNSPNIIKAVEYARLKKAQVISLVGFSGGKLKPLSDVAIHYESYNYGICEDAQLMFSHLCCQFLHEKIKRS